MGFAGTGRMEMNDDGVVKADPKIEVRSNGETIGAGAAKGGGRARTKLTDGRRSPPGMHLASRRSQELSDEWIGSGEVQ